MERSNTRESVSASPQFEDDGSPEMWDMGQDTDFLYCICTLNEKLPDADFFNDFGDDFDDDDV